ncbi:tol-Pal system protein TolA-like [Conger conger]|uniref:tol-Pal system protein TolA-like n=1 Tax=Conger conger TaxID=82655 RepID=UPI002A5AA38F|nr:tol-Pal system protein TolA-like [Conger conger]
MEVVVGQVAPKPGERPELDGRSGKATAVDKAGVMNAAGVESRKAQEREVFGLLVSWGKLALWDSRNQKTSQQLASFWAKYETVKERLDMFNVERLTDDSLKVAIVRMFNETVEESDIVTWLSRYCQGEEVGKTEGEAQGEGQEVEEKNSKAQEGAGEKGKEGGEVAQGKGMEDKEREEGVEEREVMAGESSGATVERRVGKKDKKRQEGEGGDQGSLVLFPEGSLENLYGTPVDSDSEAGSMVTVESEEEMEAAQAGVMKRLADEVVGPEKESGVKKGRVSFRERWGLLAGESDSEPTASSPVFPQLSPNEWPYLGVDPPTTGGAPGGEEAEPAGGTKP